MDSLYALLKRSRYCGPTKVEILVAPSDSKAPGLIGMSLATTFETSLLLKTLWATAMKIEPPNVWMKMMMDVPSATCVSGRTR